MELQVGVKIMLENPEGKILLLRRSPEKYPEVKNHWDIVGGRINPGVPLIDNLRREIREETGMEYSGEPKLVAAQDILRVPGRHVVRLTYRGEISGEPNLSDESMEFKWFSREELKNLDGLDEYFGEVLKSL